MQSLSIQESQFFSILHDSGKANRTGPVVVEMAKPVGHQLHGTRGVRRRSFMENVVVRRSNSSVANALTDQVEIVTEIEK